MGAQTWSLENICMNLTSDSNQVKIDEEYKGHVTYSKKVSVGTDCGILPATIPEQRPTSPPSDYFHSPWPAIKTSNQIRPTIAVGVRKRPYIVKPIDSGSDYLMPLLVAFGSLITASVFTLYCLKKHKKCWWKK